MNLLAITCCRLSQLPALTPKNARLVILYKTYKRFLFPCEITQRKVFHNLIFWIFVFRCTGTDTVWLQVSSQLLCLSAGCSDGPAPAPPRLLTPSDHDHDPTCRGEASQDDLDGSFYNPRLLTTRVVVSNGHFMLLFLVFTRSARIH